MKVNSVPTDGKPGPDDDGQKGGVATLLDVKCSCVLDGGTWPAVELASCFPRKVNLKEKIESHHWRN